MISVAKPSAEHGGSLCITLNRTFPNIRCENMISDKKTKVQKNCQRAVERRIMGARRIDKIRSGVPVAVVGKRQPSRNMTEFDTSATWWVPSDDEAGCLGSVYEGLVSHCPKP